MSNTITKITKVDIREISLVANPIDPATVISNAPEYLAEKYGLIYKEASND